MTIHDPQELESSPEAPLRWGYQKDGREFVAYQHTREQAIELFAKVLGVFPDEVEVVLLEPVNDARLDLDERKAPGA